MRSDEEVERLLEDWLTDEAQPMPQEVLENTLESVARTPQTRARTLAWGWIRGPVGAIAAAAVLILVIVAGGLTIDRIGSLIPTQSASAGPVEVWNPVADFGRWSNRTNPSPDSYGNPEVWSYLNSSLTHTPVVYELLPTLAGSTWTDQRFVNLYALLDGRGLELSPWKGPDSERFIILGWKSPIAGTVNVAGTFALVNDTCTGSGITFSVDRVSESLLMTEIPTGGSDDFALSTTIQRGDSLYFIVGSGATSTCDSTNLTLEITHP